MFLECSYMNLTIILPLSTVYKMMAGEHLLLSYFELEWRYYLIPPDAIRSDLKIGNLSISLQRPNED